MPIDSCLIPVINTPGLDYVQKPCKEVTNLYYVYINYASNKSGCIIPARLCMLVNW